MIVPTKITVEIDKTTVDVMCGVFIQTGWYILNNTPAMNVPQPNTTNGGLS